MFSKYFATNLSGQMREFYASSVFFDLGASMVAIFEPIYLYSIGFSLQKIILFFLASYAVYFVIMPLGGKFARQKGYEHSIALGTPFLILYFLFLYGIQYSSLWIAPAALCFALHRTFYWPGVRSILSRYSTDEESGRTFSGLVALSVIVTVVGPIAGGALLAFFGFPILFLVASVIILVSNIPMLRTPETFEPHDLSYVNAYHRLLRPDMRKIFFSHLGYGEEFIAEFLIPIFILLFIPSYFAIGALVSAGALVTLIVVLLIGRYTDEHHRHPVLHAGVVLTAASYVVRIFAFTPLGVLFSQTFYRASRLTITVPFLSIASRKARDYSVMKSSIFYEMSIVIAKMATALIALALVSFFDSSWQAIFILGAALTFFYGIL